MPFTSTELAARIERAESRMIEEGALAVRRRLPESDLYVVPLAGGVAAATIPGSPFNKVAGVGFAGPLDGDELTEIERQVAARGVPVHFEVSTLGDTAIVSLLSERGYRLVGFENVLGLELARAGALARDAVEGVEVARSLPDEWPRWLDTVVTGFETPDTQGVPSTESFPRQALEDVMTDMASTPGFLSYLARRGGEIVGGGGLRLDADGVAQLCGAATLPAARRRGVQTALLAQRLADAAARGCDIAVVTTQPGSKSCQNVQKWGFELLYARAVMVREDAAG